MITDIFGRMPLEKIVYDRAERQRQPGDKASEVDVADLADSIAKRGVVHPILLEAREDGKFHLIMGERRFLASTQLRLPDIPYRLVKDLTELERQIIEWEENVKRRDIHWKDYVKGITKIHGMLCILDDTWTHEKTALEMGINRMNVSAILRVSEELNNPLVAEATGWRPAYNIVARKDSRGIDDAMNDLLADHILPPTGPNPTQLQVIATVAEAWGIKPRDEPLGKAEREQSIFKEDFLKWAPLYSGKRFSFIHCDFPYGIDLDESDQAKSSTYGGYADSNELYWELCSCLCKHRDRLLTQSSHIMFWLKLDVSRMEETHAFFMNAAPDLRFFQLPLIWHKTDNRGILADSKRGPRNVCEVALFASRSDRLIVRAVSNCYGSQTTKEIHQSEKPEPMLRHFFSMFVDENTRMLDPTCGSATSLRAAESLGAEVLGLEIDETLVEAARSKLRHFRNLRALEKKHG